MANPVVLLFRGLPSGAGEAQMVAFLLLPWLLLLVALMCSFLAVRHTRGDEEDGRLELVSATAAGRTAPLVATALHGVGASIVAGAVVAVIFVASGAPPAGAALIAAGCTLAGTVFLGVGLVSAELMPTSRAANALAVWLVVGTFVLAGAGNAWDAERRPHPDDELRARVVLAVRLGGEHAPLRHGRRVAAGGVGARNARPARRRRAPARPPRPGRLVRSPAHRTRRGTTRFATHLALTVRQSAAHRVDRGGAARRHPVDVARGRREPDRTGQPGRDLLLQALSGTSADLSRGLIVVFFVMLGIFAAAPRRRRSCGRVRTRRRGRRSSCSAAD
jgi:ABC-2 type transport system permease protein